MKAKGLLFTTLFILLCVGCEQSPQPTTVIITRNSPPQLHLAPLSKNITNTANVQNLYNAALNLKTVSGPINCTTSSYGGLNYQMRFMSGNDLVKNMNLDAATCRLLTIGQSDVRQTTPAFLNLFVKTFGIPSLLPK